MRNIDYIFVHCTASPQTWTIDDLMREFKNKGWKNPGYHVAITADGTRHQLLPFEKVSNGVKGHNYNSVNVAYFGGMHGKDNRTEAQKRTLVEVLKELRAMYPKARILGHREVFGDDPSKWQKLCPCFFAGEEYKDI